MNHVALVGRCGQYGCKISWTEQGKPQTSFALVVESTGKAGEAPYRTFIPILVVGARAEAVCETVESRDLLAVEGKLSWKVGKTKDSGKLMVVTFDAERLAEAPAAVEATPA